MNTPALLLSGDYNPVVVERFNENSGRFIGFAKGHAGTIYWDRGGKAFACNQRRRPRLDLCPADVCDTRREGHD